MDICFNKLYKIDINQNEANQEPPYKNDGNFKKYIQGMLELLSTKSPDRLYTFNSEHTEVRKLISNILTKHEYEDTSKAIANRLLLKEKEAQDIVDKRKLGVNIQQGMLIVSLVKMTNKAKKLIILKVDYDEFIAELTGEIATGLSTRKKMYKAFVGEINNQNNIEKITLPSHML